MTNKLFSNLLLFSLFGTTMWFFGNLYEGIVIAPNMLENSIQRMHSWQDFFVVTNPIFYYVPLPPLATVALVVLYFKTPNQKTALKRRLKMASIFQIASIVLSIYIITQINLKLFFGDLEKYTDEIQSMAILWNVLNVFRLALVATALTFTFKVYVQIQKENN